MDKYGFIDDQAGFLLLTIIMTPKIKLMKIIAKAAANSPTTIGAQPAPVQAHPDSH